MDRFISLNSIKSSDSFFLFFFFIICRYVAVHSCTSLLKRKIKEKKNPAPRGVPKVGGPCNYDRRKKKTAPNIYRSPSGERAVSSIRRVGLAYATSGRFFFFFFPSAYWIIYIHLEKRNKCCKRILLRFKCESIASS